MKSKGFTFIEIIIVFSIVGLIMALAIPGFDNFNRNQILKTAAENLKFSFREAQYASLSGKKEECNPLLCPDQLANPPCCTNDTLNEIGYCSNKYTLIGHYITLHKGMTKYSIGIYCGITGVVTYPVKNVSFSNGDIVSVDSIVDDRGVKRGEGNNEIMVIFKPVNKGVGFYEFSNGQPESYQLGLEEDIESLTVYLTIGNSQKYSVTVSSVGEIYETKL